MEHRIKIEGLESLRKQERETLVRRANEELEDERAEHRAQVEHREEFQRNREESERRRRSVDEHTRTMEARDKVARQIAERSGISHTEAVAQVSEAMRTSRRR